MKPQKQFFGTSRQAVEPVADRRKVLIDRLVAAHGAIESDTFRRRLMVVGRRPVGARRLGVFRHRRVVVAADEMVQAERHRVVHEGFARRHHHADDRGDCFLVVRERHARPLIGDRARAERRVPRETARRIPVRLRKMMAAPIRVAAGIDDRGHAGDAVRMNGALERPGDARSLALRERVRFQKLLPHRSEIDEVLRLTQILLCRLNLGEDGRLLQRAEQRVEWLARLKVDGAVLDLHQHVRTKLPVELRELEIRALRAIGIDILVIDERAPDDVAAVRGHRIRQHVGAFGVRSAVVLGPRLPLGVRFDEKPAEIGDERVDLVGLRLPPCDNAGIERIRGLEAPDPNRRGDIGGEIHAHAVRTPDAARAPRLWRGTPPTASARRR